MALGGALGPGLGAAVTPVTPRHFCVAGVALGDIHLDFTWQAWHNLTSTVVYRRLPRHFCVAGVALGDIPTLISRGRRGTTSHLPSFTVVLRGRRGTDGTGWRPWAGFRRRRDARDAAPLLRGRRGTW